MKPFRDQPIQQKMLMMTLIIVGTILLVAITALFTFQVLNFRSNFQSDAETLAVVIANNSTAALAFKDAAAARKWWVPSKTCLLWFQLPWSRPTARYSRSSARRKMPARWHCFRRFDSLASLAESFSSLNP